VTPEDASEKLWLVELDGVVKREVDQFEAIVRHG